MEIPTNMHLLTFLATCVLFTTTECGTRFQECPAIVDTGTVGILICENYTEAETTWEFTSGQAAFATLGQCTNSTCTSDPLYDNIFNLTAINGTSSQLTLTTTFTAGLKTVTFACDGVNCVVNISEPVPPSTTPEATTEATTEVVTTGSEESSSSSPVVTTGSEESSSSSPVVTTGTEKSSSSSPVVTTGTEESSSSSSAQEEGGLTGGQTAGIATGAILGCGVIIGAAGGIVRYKKKKKRGTETNGNETGNATPLNDTVPNKPANPNGTGSETTGNGTGNTTSSNAIASDPGVPADGQP